MKQKITHPKNVSTKDHQIKKLTDLNDALENYFSNTVIPQLFVDAKLKLQKFTPPAMKQFNLKKNDLGKSINDIKENFRYPSIVSDIQLVIKSGKVLEKEIQTTDFRWYQMSILPYIKQQDKTTNGVIVTFVDTTMRIKDLKELENVIEGHELLLDTISHDIKSPLTSLLLTIKELKKVPPEKSKQFQLLFKILENSVIKMEHIITDLTDNRKHKHKNRDEKELITFESILEDVRLLITGNIKKSEAVIKSKFNVHEIRYSRSKLRSIIYNLVSNAVKFKSPHGTPEIFIKTTREKEYVVISVKDNGIGINKSDQGEVFSKYFRVENEVEGSGIGLYLVKENVTAQGGKIILKSQIGKGSEFKVYLKAK
jgi:two-component system phosphate regulon sensor histidine kinase PhoR